MIFDNSPLDSLGRRVSRAASRRFLSAGLVAALLAGAGAAFAQETDGGPGYEKPTLRQRYDQAVAAFAIGPASILLEPEEVNAYRRLTGREVRFQFIEDFWSSIAAGCPPGPNPARETFWSRVEEVETTEAYRGEGIPTWMTDRGKAHVLLGAPGATEEGALLVGGRERVAVIWRYEATETRSARTLVFVSDRIGYRLLAAADSVDAVFAESLSAERIGRVDELFRQFASDFRQSICGGAAGATGGVEVAGWRTELWDAAGAVLEGSATGGGDVSPQWYFFPASEGATFTMLTVPLDAQPAEGTRLVAQLRSADDPENSSAILGTEFPFEIRETKAGVIAQSARAVLPGSYGVVVALVDENDAVTALHSGEQLVVRLPQEQLRMTSVILADRYEQLTGDAGAGAYRIGGYDIVPRVGRSFTAGDEVTLFFQVVGATTSEAGSTDLSVSYQLVGKNPKSGKWQNIQQPQVSRGDGAVRVWSLPIGERFPKTSYKIEIEVIDQPTGLKVTKEVTFDVGAS